MSYLKHILITDNKGFLCESLKDKLFKTDLDYINYIFDSIKTWRSFESVQNDCLEELKNDLINVLKNNYGLKEVSNAAAE